jgi:hypothetical protein
VIETWFFSSTISTRWVMMSLGMTSMIISSVNSFLVLPFVRKQIAWESSLISLSFG